MTSGNEILITSLELGRDDVANLEFLSEENKFTELKGKIEGRLKKIEENYGKINDITSPIVEEKYFGGLIKSTNVEKSLDGLLEIIKDLAKHTLNAFKTNGENLNDILVLMKVLASIENDLYKQLEVSDCSKEAIANLLHDFCSQYNIDNQAIEELFEQSFHRTITLKAKIKDLREEVLSHISDRIKDINDIITKKEDDVKSFIKQSNTECNFKIESDIKDLHEEVLSHISDRIQDINDIITKKEDDVKSFIKLLNTECNFKLDSEIKRCENLIIDKTNKQYDTLESFKRENKTLKDEVHLLNQRGLKLQERLKWYSVVSVAATAIAVISLII